MKKNWKAFRNTGLLYFVNEFLHIFGYAINIEKVDNKIVDVYPEKVNYTGLSEKSNEEAYIKASQFMKDNMLTVY